MNGNGDETGYDEPTGPGEEGGAPGGEFEDEAGDVEAAEPDEGAAEDAAASEAAAEAETDVDNSVLEAHDAASKALARVVEEADGQVQSEAEVEGLSNIVGVGLATADEADTTSADPGAVCLSVYVAEPCSIDDVKATLMDSMGIHACASDDFPVNVVVTGQIDADSHRFRIRPAPGGVSVGHFRITAGTLGCLARGLRSPRDRRVLILSNNHVLADSNRGRFGDAILQPGRADGGRNPRDRIAILERFVPIRFGGRTCNYVDCSTGWAWSNLVRREMIYRSSRGLRLFRISSRVVPCRRNMMVGKTGRTTQLTTGRVTDCSATVRVNYGGGRIALFCRQMIVRGLGRPFSAGGDSGSVIWTYDRSRNPVGLLFAGNTSNNITIANHMTHVVRALDVRLWT